ncbi:MAG: sporulation protein YabP [Clostridia bacterium]|nr:sporulation protein YabP [Clostridia bacterium]
MATDDRVSTLRKKHGMILEDRKSLTLTGVKDVSGFDEQKVTLLTELGELTVKGSELRINDFSNDSGELSLEGCIDSLAYAEAKQAQGGFFSRIFK